MEEELQDNGRKTLNMKTPESMDVRVDKDGVAEIVGSDTNLPKKTSGQNSIKELINNKVIGELDVETNYLRASAQNFGDELHLKTVFQKRGPMTTTNTQMNIVEGEEPEQQQEDIKGKQISGE